MSKYEKLLLHHIKSTYRRKISYRYIMIGLLIIICVLSPKTLSSAKDMKLYNTAAEEIRVGYYSFRGFCEIESDGSLSGYGIDYMNEIAKIANWNIKYKVYHNYEDALKAFRSRDIDILAPSYSAARDERYNNNLYPIGTEYISLLTLNNKDNYIFEDYDSFDGMTVGCVKNSVFLSDFKNYQKKNNFSVKYKYYDDTSKLFYALRKGQVDSVLSNLMSKREDMKILAQFGAMPYYFMVEKKSEKVTEALNEAIDVINTQKHHLLYELEEKYLSKVFYMPFSKKELEYLKNTKVIQVACKEDAVPFSYYDKSIDRMNGIDIAILNHISLVSGLNFEFIGVPNNIDIKEHAIEHDIPLVVGIENSSRDITNEEHYYTNNYMNSLDTFIGYKDTKFTTLQSMKIAIVSTDDKLLQQWQLKYPNFTFIQYSSIQKCLNAVRKHSVDMVLYDRYKIENLLERPINEDLSILPVDGVNVGRCIEIINNGNEQIEILQSIINKSITHISNDEIESYLSSYIQRTRYHYTIKDFTFIYHKPLIIITIVIAIVIVIITISVRMQQKSRRIIEYNEKRLMNQLRFENRRIELILSKVEEIFYEINLQTGFISLSPSFEERLGWSFPSEIDVFKEIDLTKLWHVMPNDEHKLREANHTLLEEKAISSCTVRVQGLDEQYIWCEILQYPILDDAQNIISIIGLIKNVDSIVIEREKLKDKAMRDQLTGLYNKETFEREVTKSLHNNPTLNSAILFVDLDHFKEVNDTLGHIIGDKAICETSYKLQQVFTENDIIARFGGDEFCIFVKNTSKNELRKKLKNLITIMNVQYSSNKGTVATTCSCGVAFAKDVCYEYNELLSSADDALYQSKASGRNKYTFYKQRKNTFTGYKNN